MTDVVVVGGGPGGYAAAFRAAVRGLDVALVEADKVGGTCLHRGCIPSKSLLHVAEIAHEASRTDLGLEIEVKGVDLPTLRDFRDHVVGTMHKGLQGIVKARGITYHEGWGRIVEPGVVEVDVGGGRERVEANHIVVATGSVPRTLPDVEVDGRVVVTSDHALEVERLPERAVIIGAGAIGMEFATFWRSMGAEVTVVELLDRVLPLEDADSSKLMQRAFRRAGIEVRTGARVEQVVVDDGTARVSVTAADDAEELVADTVLVAVGRRPNLESVGAEALGIVGDGGFVAVDDFRRTSVDGVWAIGDVTPGLQLAHSAFAEGFQVADAIAGLDVTPVDDAHVPRVTYCRPEVASVGLTEEEARGRFDDVENTVHPLRAVAKGLIAASDGHVKLVHRGRDGETLGVHVVAPHATDLIAEASLVTYWGAYPSEVAQVVHAHPTLSEVLGEAFLAAAGTPFHTH
ncbi:MAG: dihydrolipoyl dehydrogenase [Nitriliruptorales bacterium]